jgi:DNA-binding response OmpR family regulator
MNATTQTNAKPLVLVAAADPAERKQIWDTLEGLGFRIVTAEDGSAAFGLFTKTQPDVVLLDVELPVLDGLAVCKSIRAHDAGGEVPILMMADRDDELPVQRAYGLGATDVVIKPLAYPMLPHRIRHSLKTARSLSDLTGLIRAIPDLIFIVNEDGEVQHGLSGPDATHTLQIKALATASQINFYPCENDDTATNCLAKAWNGQ